MIRFFSSLSILAQQRAQLKRSKGQDYRIHGSDIQDEAAQKFYAGKETTRKARLAMKPEPNYTEQARQNQIMGTVVLKAVFSANGSVKNIKLVSGLPFGLTEMAIAAASKIQFIPGS